tara:strand:- start:797 stop:1312 length:516 start_codon:yes stop_codon:yes gene_type:complete
MILKEAASKELLNLIYRTALQSQNWNFLYPIGVEEKHAKLTIYSILEHENIKDKFLLGLCISLLLEIYKNGGKNYFTNNFPSYVGVSIKDMLRSDNTHTDQNDHYKKNTKILGILNPEWKHEWGGGFIHGEKLYRMEPGDFVVFDSLVPHRAEDIKVNKKRVALDFSLDGI